METNDTGQIMAQLRAFIRERFRVPESDSDFTDDVHLFDYGYIDSFGAVELTTFVKTTFSTEITETDLVAYPLNTVREIATFVTKRKKGEL
jgi:methoxymalonate biosynthesis acyl carrier protein